MGAAKLTVMHSETQQNSPPRPDSAITVAQAFTTQFQNSTLLVASVGFWKGGSRGPIHPGSSTGLARGWVAGLLWMMWSSAVTASVRPVCPHRPRLSLCRLPRRFRQPFLLSGK